MSQVSETNKTVSIQFDDKSFSLPLYRSTFDEAAIDISSLKKQADLYTIDIGYKNTGATISKITYIDGDKGILLHRGYPIEQLAGNADFPEIIYLLLYGELPNKQQLAEIQAELVANLEVPGQIKNILDALPDTMHPMGMLTTAFIALSGFYPESLDSWADEEIRHKSIFRLLGHMPTMVAYIYRRIMKQPYVDPNPNLSYVANFLYMMSGKVSPEITEALDTLLILHADHEQNCSTSTVRLSGSSQVNLFAAIAAGNCSLWGPLHGGANQEVLEMLEAIQKDGGDIEKYINKAKDKNDGFRLMGFGHRVYKNYDPRAKVIKKYVEVVLNMLNVQDPLLGIAKQLEEAALNDSYFVDRKLFPNVDFYSGIIYRALEIPTEMFTVMFAFGRLPGWISQWKELRESNEPIGRPLQLYTGNGLRDFTPLADRG